MAQNRQGEEARLDKRAVIKMSQGHSSTMGMCEECTCSTWYCICTKAVTYKYKQVQAHRKWGWHEEKASVEGEGIVRPGA